MDGSLPPLSATAGLSATLDRLFRGHHRWLNALLRKRYGTAEAEDLAQETYLRVARSKLASDVRDPKAFLITVATNVARDRARRGRLDIDEEAGGDALESLSCEPSQNEELIFREIVLALPEDLRDVFILNHLEGLTYSEIAALKGLPWTTVHHRMRKALERVTAAMRD